MISRAQARVQGLSRLSSFKRLFAAEASGTITRMGDVVLDKPWSQWEMIENLEIKNLLELQDLLTHWSLLLHRGGIGAELPEELPFPLREKWRNSLEQRMSWLSNKEFSMCKFSGDRLMDKLQWEKRPDHLVGDVDDLRRRLLDQAHLIACFLLSSKERSYYEPDRPIFGSEFQARFANGGAFELDEAAKCLALSRSTACVFHLMRLMEIAVRAVARCLGIPDPNQPADRSWGAVLKKIRDGIDRKWPTVAARSAGDGETFDALYASLDAVKNPWRNATMHPANKYTTEEAEHVFVAVRGFAMKLADRCDENGDPKA